MKVWLAERDDRDFDMGSVELIGVYSTKENAEKALEVDEERYRSEPHNFGKDVSFNVYWVWLDDKSS